MALPVTPGEPTSVLDGITILIEDSDLEPKHGGPLGAPGDLMEAKAYKGIWWRLEKRSDKRSSSRHGRHNITFTSSNGNLTRQPYGPHSPAPSLAIATFLRCCLVDSWETSDSRGNIHVTLTDRGISAGVFLACARVALGGHGVTDGENRSVLFRVGMRNTYAGIPPQRLCLMQQTPITPVRCLVSLTTQAEPEQSASERCRWSRCLFGKSCLVSNSVRMWSGQMYSLRPCSITL
ncbi:hypothetical protein Bbelb_323170 [Branchiostoma belcheri]|nr:hypothetical protein Bbelb_323170 [Branchiostoma belcheri]